MKATIRTHVTPTVVVGLLVIFAGIAPAQAKIIEPDLAGAPGEQG